MEKNGCPRNFGFRRTWFKRSQACKADILNKMGFERTKQAKSPILLRLLPWENVYKDTLNIRKSCFSKLSRNHWKGLMRGGGKKVQRTQR